MPIWPTLAGDELRELDDEVSEFDAEGL